MSRSRAVPMATRRGSARVGGQRPPDAGARHGLVERETLATPAHDLLEVGQACARLADDDQVARRVLEHLVERADVEQHVDAGGRRAPRQLGAAAPGDDGEAVRGAGAEDLGDLAGVRRPGHRPGSTPSTCRPPRRRGRRHTPSRPPRAAVRVQRGGPHQNTSARPASWSGWAPFLRPGTSPHSRGVGKTLPGFEIDCGSKAQRTSCIVSRSSSVYIRGM